MLTLPIPMSKTVLSQLQKVIADLETEEATLEQRVLEIKAKQQAVYSVLDLFEPFDASTPAEVVESIDALPLATSEEEAVPTEPESSTTEKKKAARRSGQKKDGRAADWQKYTMSDFKGQPMPEAVKNILSTAPDEDFKIADVMSTLFKESMPKAQYLKARNRISNVLSAGARSGEWHKGERSAYRLSALG